MVVCETCNTQGQFRVVSGFYYCNVCDTQSQHAVEEEFEMAFEDGDTTRLNRVTSGQTSKKQKAKKLIDRRYRTYRRINLYNDLIRKQVDELICLGAPSRLKVAVMELWFKYIDVLEMDSGPYGKLPPYCMKEELEMASKRVKEDSFGMKRVVYNHPAFRSSTLRAAEVNEKYYKSHPLHGYGRPQDKRSGKAGLNEIFSNLSSVDTSEKSSLPCDSPRKLPSLSEDEIPLSQSGFGFGSLDTSGFGFSQDSQASLESDSRMSVEEDVPSFSFAMSSQEENVKKETKDRPASVSKVEAETDENKMDTTEVTKVDEVDLTSQIAYKLKAYMEKRGIRDLESYIESVLQMRCSSLILVLFIGLVQSKVNHIGITDLYRFIRHSQLTYCEARTIASEELLKARRFIFHKASLPQIDPHPFYGGSFVKSAAILCGLLDIRELQMPSLAVFISRICLDLNLPRDLMAMALAIAKRHNLQPTWTLTDEDFPYLNAEALPHMEAHACVVILIVLKYQFGLDGKTEYALSREAELKSHQENKKYFVVSHWLTQLSRRARFLRRRGEFDIPKDFEFEHIQSAAYIVKHSSKRRQDFYYQGKSFRKCIQFIDDLNIPDRLESIKLNPTSWPMTGTLRQLLEKESSDSLGLLGDMTDHEVIRREGPVNYHHARQQHRRYFAGFRKTYAGEYKDIHRFIPPSQNFITLMTLLGEYCMSSSTNLHMALLKTEKIVLEDIEKELEAVTSVEL